MSLRSTNTASNALPRKKKSASAGAPPTVASTPSASSAPS